MAEEVFRGMNRLLARVRRMREAIEDPGAAGEAMGRMALASVERNFQAGGRPRPWKPLAPATLKRKGGGGSILDRTGAMRHGVVVRTTRQQVRLESPQPYARPVHEVRPWLMFQEEDKEAAGSIWMTHIRGGEGGEE